MRWARLVVEGSLKQFSMVPTAITLLPGSGRPSKSLSTDGTYVLVLPFMSRLILGVWTAEEVKTPENSVITSAIITVDKNPSVPKTRCLRRVATTRPETNGEESRITHLER